MTFLKQGDKIGNYSIISLLGEGGMGSVYLAHHELLQEKVALKVLHPRLVTYSQMVERFLREARSIFRINHPHVIRIHEVGQINEFNFFSMDYIEGQSLSSILSSEKTISESRIIRIADQILSALEEAHKNGVVHRDIKPENILINSKDHVVVTDFGIAKINEDQKLTITGSFVGTVSYTSPEQAKGENANPQSDLYSLGITLYEMATGSVPFKGPNPTAILYKHVHENPTPPKNVAPEISDHLNSIIMRSITKTRDQRFTSATLMRKALSKNSPSFSSTSTAKGFKWVIVLAILFLGLGSAFLLNKPSKNINTPSLPNKTLKISPTEKVIPKTIKVSEKAQETKEEVSKTISSKKVLEEKEKTPHTPQPQNSFSFEPILFEVEKLKEKINSEHSLNESQIENYLATFRSKKNLLKELYPLAFQKINLEIKRLEEKKEKLVIHFSPDHPIIDETNKNLALLKEKRKELWHRSDRFLDYEAKEIIHLLNLQFPDWIINTVSRKQLMFSINQQLPLFFEILLNNETPLRWILIPGGTFSMGSNGFDSPSHEIQIYPFYMGITEVTQKQWTALVNVNPSEIKNPSHPVETVSWLDCYNFLKRLNHTPQMKQYDFQVRLPYEAEWEYACRADTTTNYHWGPKYIQGKTNALNRKNLLSPKIINQYQQNSFPFESTLPVASFQPNPWGIFDFHGNVREWCFDYYHKDYYINSPLLNPQGPTEGDQKVLRGGSWPSQAKYCTSAYRFSSNPKFKSNHYGFRMVLETPGTREFKKNHLLKQAQLAIPVKDESNTSEASHSTKPATLSDSINPSLVEVESKAISSKLIIEKLSPFPTITPLAPAKGLTLTVDQNDPSNFNTINEAIQKALPNSRILIKPGRYSEHIELSKTVELIGDGPKEQILIFGLQGKGCIDITAKSGLIRNLTFRFESTTHQNPYLMDIKMGSILIEDCLIESKNTVPIAIRGHGSKPQLKHLTIKGGNKSGLRIYGGSQPHVSFCKIYNFTHQAVEVVSPLTIATLNRCIISDSNTGIKITNSASLIAKGLEVNQCKSEAILCEKNSTLKLEHSIISQNQNNGIVLSDKSKANIKKCDITKQNESGLLVFQQSVIHLTQSRLHQNEMAGFFIKQFSKANFNNVDIFYNGKNGIHLEDSSEANLSNVNVFLNKAFGILLKTHSSINGTNLTINSNRQGKFSKDNTSLINITES